MVYHMECMNRSHTLPGPCVKLYTTKMLLIVFIIHRIGIDLMVSCQNVSASLRFYRLAMFERSVNCAYILGKANNVQGSDKDLLSLIVIS